MIPLIMVVGFMVVVLVMILVLSLGQGLSRTFAQTGSADVAIVLSSGAYSEPESHFDEDQVRAIGTHPKTGAKMAAINVRCLDGVDVDALTVKKVDGRSL